MRTISDDTSPVAAVWFALLGGTFRLRRCRHGVGWEVLDDNGRVIGSADDYPYGSRGFAVRTRAFAGFIPREDVQMVER